MSSQSSQIVVLSANPVKISLEEVKKNHFKSCLGLICCFQFLEVLMNERSEYRVYCCPMTSFCSLMELETRSANI